MAKKDLGSWHGSGFISGRATTPMPHNQGYKSAGAEGPKRLSPAKPKKKTTTRRTGLKDKYGRKITRAEYERREKFRERRKKMTVTQAKTATRTEMERRKKWRASAKKSLGSSVTKVTRNKDLAKGTSSRYVSKKTAGKGPAAESRIRSKYRKR